MAHLNVIRRICQEIQLKVEVGGGVRSEESIDALLAAGVTRVILGTAALQNWAWFRDLVAKPAYRNRLVLDLGVHKGKLTVSGWEKSLDATPLDIAREVSAWPLAAMVYTDVSVDGTMAGPNLAATRAIAHATRVPVIASGGVGTLDHLKQLRHLPIQGVIVGKALYENAFTVAQAIAVVEGDPSR